MSIEIYNKAKVIKKGEKYYYFLKYHSKNDCICGGQYIIDDNFKTKYIQRNSRAGSWSIKAIAERPEYDGQRIQRTKWNCPTSYIYGQIMFGNKKNIALYWAKQKAKNYEDFTPDQQKNIDNCIKWAESDGKKYVIDLTKEIADKDDFKAEHEYCGVKYGIADYTEYKTYFMDKIYWNLDNL